MVIGVLDWDHVENIKKEMADAGIQRDAVVSQLLPNYTKQKEF